LYCFVFSLLSKKYIRPNNDECCGGRQAHCPLYARRPKNGVTTEWRRSVHSLICSSPRYIYSRVFYKERCYNEGELQRTLLQRTFLSIKSRGYNERGGILSADVTRPCVRRVGPSHFD
jgi:hypothetical protein